jgi:NAD(P)-dependent dehydrogenase (short-subunit alcohol dehydrogenase family)
MSSVFITGSADGLGQMAARSLVAGGHRVLLHGRDQARAEAALAAVPGADGAVAGDLASLAGTRELAAEVNSRGPFDAVIHNAGVGYREPARIETVDGLAHVFQINALAPYLLTALIEPRRRLVYMSSGLHRSGEPGLEDAQWESRPWEGLQAYSDSKLFDVMLAFGVARRLPSVRSNALEPGWVATKMGGPGAPDDLDQAADTQVWLAVDPETEESTGGYYFHLHPRDSHPAASDPELQNRLLDYCAELTGTAIPSE